MHFLASPQDFARILPGGKNSLVFIPVVVRYEVFSMAKLPLDLRYPHSNPEGHAGISDRRIQSLSISVHSDSGSAPLYNFQLRHELPVEVLRNGEEGTREEGPQSD
jgi:hypothetical protein